MHKTFLMYFKNWGSYVDVCTSHYLWHVSIFKRPSELVPGTFSTCVNLLIVKVFHLFFNILCSSIAPLQNNYYLPISKINFIK